MGDPITLHGPADWTVDLALRLWAWLLRRAFNPESARGLRLGDLQRRPVWLSRRNLIAMYGPEDSATRPGAYGAPGFARRVEMGYHSAITGRARRHS